MKQNDTRKLSTEKQQHNRDTAIRLYETGRSQREIASLLGVHARTVHAWISDYKEGGLAAIEIDKRGRPSGASKLSKDHQAAIKQSLLSSAPIQLDLKTELWTALAIRGLILKNWRIIITHRTVQTYMKLWGLAPVKPSLIAAQRAPKRVQRWMDNTLVSIKAQAKAERALVFWIDYSPVFEVGSKALEQGHHPHDQADRNSNVLHMLSAVDNRGKIAFLEYEGVMSATFLITFFHGLIRDNQQKVAVILDHFPVKQAKNVRNWLIENRSMISAHFLPAGELPFEADLLINPEDITI